MCAKDFQMNEETLSNVYFQNDSYGLFEDFRPKIVLIMYNGNDG